MQSRAWLYLLAGVLAGGCAPPADEEAEGAAPPATESATAADEAAIEELRAAYVSHYNQRQAESVAALYADSAMAAFADGVIAHGRPAILADLQADLAMNVMLDLTSEDVMVIGEHAVAHGTWTVTPGDGSTMPGSLSGNYLTYFTKASGDWRIGFAVTNYNAPPPEGTPVVQEETAPPPEIGTMKDLANAYAQAFNAGDAAAVAAMYTEDGFHSFANQPPTRGRAALQSALGERFTAGQPTIEIHDVGTVDAGDGWAIDGGWFMLTVPAEGGATTVETGVYANVLRQQPDGSWKIHWGLSNVNPET